jgi:hypothetical protein
MKNQFMTTVCIGCVLMLAATNLIAQENNPVKSLPTVTITSTHTKVPEKVWQSFQNYYATAESPAWYELNKRFLVKFMTEDKANQAVFTKHGRMVYNISYGYETNLPDDIKKSLRSKYFEYNIARAVKVSQDNRTIWLVNVEDAKNMILVRLEDDEMEEIERFIKS